MLPGEAPPGCKGSEKNKYAENAVRHSLYLLRKSEGNIHSSAIFIVGAGNVLKRKDDTICRDNLLSIAQIVKKYDIKVTCMATGGTQRRSVSLDLKEGVFYCNKGDGKQQKLWSFNKAG
jgi:chemotaxis receptor (MCP) glutamine deamidase CheD